MAHASLPARLLALRAGVAVISLVVGQMHGTVARAATLSEALDALPAAASRPHLPGSDDAPVAVAAHVIETAGVTRLSVDLSGPVAINAFLLEKPARIIVDLPQVNFQLDPRVGRLPGRGVGLVRSFRYGLFAPGKSRIVVDLAGPASLRKAAVEPIAAEGGPSRLTLEIGGSDRAAFHAAAARREATPPDAASAAAEGAPSGGLPVVVVDPGHGGVDPGAHGVDGVVEKTVTFDFARALASRLEATGRYRVVLTRRGDSFVSLGDRVRIARDAGAALFISIHADTLSDPAVTGATVYTASDRASDAEAARVAAAENKADEAAGLTEAPDTAGVNDILFDLTRRETRTYAHLFQRTLVGYWQKIARLNKNPERAAGFKVLQAPDVPSVLLELGYLSSQSDSRMLVSPEWRDKAAATIAASVDRFFGRGDSPSVQGATSKVVSAQSHP